MRKINYRFRYWEDVEENEIIPEVKLPITYRRVIQSVAATRDFFPAFFSPEYAQAQGIENIYLNTMVFEGFVDKVVTSWGGPHTWIRKRKIRMLRPVPAGSTLTCTGKVVKKYVINEEFCLDLELILQKFKEDPSKTEKVCMAWVTIILPKKKPT